MARTGRTCLAAILAVCLPVGCTGGPGDRRVFFPTAAERSDGGPDGAIGGLIVERGGCVFIEYPPDIAPMLVIWPYGWSIERAPDGTHVLDENRAVAVTIGDFVQVGGGGADWRTHGEWVESITGQPIPDRCKAEGGFWVASPEIDVLPDPEA